VRRDADVLERESEKKRRVEDVRFGGAKVVAGERGGDMGPRRLLRREMAASQRVHGCVCDSPICEHPLCWV
jgi:hypothetical protein